MTAGRAPKPSSIADDLHTMIALLNIMTVEDGSCWLALCARTTRSTRDVMKHKGLRA